MSEDVEFVMINGAEVCVDDAGSGAPTFIFVHGGACDRQDWRGLIDALSKRHRTISFDLPGHGRSSKSSPQSVDFYADVTTALKDRVEGPVILVGHSLGCRVIVEACSRAPENVAGLVLIDGSVFCDGDAPDAAIAAFEAKIDKVGVADTLRFAFEQMFVPDTDPGLRAAILKTANAWDHDVARAVLLDTARWDATRARRALGDIVVPVLVLQSTFVNDRFARESLSPGMETPWTLLVESQVAQAQLCVVTGTGHFPHVEAPEVVSRHLEAFAAQLTGLEVPRQ